jgi:hypothetical protein
MLQGKRYGEFFVCETFKKESYFYWRLLASYFVDDGTTPRSFAKKGREN